MQVLLEIPDAIAAQLIPEGQEASRALLEDALVQAYREERISGRQLMETLGIETRLELDGFLKARNCWIDYSWDELQRERAAMEDHLACASGKSAGD
jgi:hypothetical protein